MDDRKRNYNIKYNAILKMIFKQKKKKKKKKKNKKKKKKKKNIKNI